MQDIQRRMKNCDKWSVAGTTTATSNNDNCTTITESEKIGNLVAHAAASINQEGGDDDQSKSVAAMTESTPMTKAKEDDGDEIAITSVENCINVNKNNGNSEVSANDSSLGGGEKKVAPPQTEEEQSNASRRAMKEQNTTKSNENQSTNNDVTMATQPQLPSSFNSTLKTALNSYHKSHTLIKSQNNPPTPMPPPFLSHAEECTIKTALAFVIAKARIGKKSLKNNVSACTSSNSIEATRNESFLNKRGGSIAVLGSTSGGRVGNVLSSHRLGNVPNQSRATIGGKSPILGGLLSAPPSSLRHIIPPSTVLSHSSITTNINLTVERKLNHVRDVLKLAVSSVLPLYRGALELKDSVGSDKGVSTATSQSCSERQDDDVDDDATTLEQSAPQSGGEDVPSNNDITGVRRPCAVYDYEAAVEPSTVVHNNTTLPRSTTSESRSSSRHATLDGLCEHAIMRLSAMIRDEGLKSRAEMLRVHRGGRTASTVGAATNGGEENDDSASNANGSPTVVTDRSRESRNRLQKGSSSVRDAIMKLIYNDLIGDAYHHGSSYTSSNHTRRLSSDIARECAEHRIEKIMAVCHVLHRLLFLDKTSLLGTEFVVVVCSILSELYSNLYCGRLLMDGDVEGDEEDGDSKSNGSSSNSNGEKQRRRTTNTNKLPVNKEKYQVVSSRWADTSSTSSVSTHVNDRHERRCQSVDILSQLRYSGVKRGSQIIQQSAEGEETGTQQKKQLPLPRIGDVLAVNLLRLLEGAAAIRLHHRQQRHAASYPSPHLASSHRHTYSYHRSSSSTRNDDSYMLEKVASMAATEVLSEIRSNVNDELIVPIMKEDAATFYFNEKVTMSHSKSRNTVLLHPGGKIMMRLHLFNLMNKLALYEQQM